ncbi:MAG: nucleobase:cation symporter-2 family protein [Dongiaceae bacterium]
MERQRRGTARGRGAAAHPVDQWLPPGRLLTLGLQHALVMYAGSIAVPLIVGRALGLAADQIAYLVNADLLACGIATFIQSFGLPGIGIRLPIMMGVTFTAVSPMLAMVAGGKAAGTPPEETLRVIYGAVIGAGIVGLLAAPLMSRLLRFFPPVVTGSVILVIGISLMPIAVNWAAGAPDPAMPGYGAPGNLAVALLVLLVILGISRFATGFLAHVAVLIGIVVGIAVSTAAGTMSFAEVVAAPLLGAVLPLHFGLPLLDPVALLTMALVMIVTMIESMGGFLAVGEMTGRPLDRAALARGLRGDGLGTIVGGLFNTFPYTSYSQNVGLVGITGVRSRHVCVAAAGVLALLGLVPKLGALVEAVPGPVLGGAGIVMFGMVAATGLRTLGRVDFAGTPANQLIVAVSIGVGMIPLASDRFFQALPAGLEPLLGSGILLTATAAVLLNLFFNGTRPAEQKA